MINKWNKMIISGICMISMLGAGVSTWAEPEQNRTEITETAPITEEREKEVSVTNRYYDEKNPENTTNDRTVMSVDENGNVFTVTDENDGVVEEVRCQSARVSSIYIVNFRANAEGKSV